LDVLTGYLGGDRGGGAVESLSVTGEIVEVRFESLKLHDAGTRDVSLVSRKVFRRPVGKFGAKLCTDACGIGRA
jgi:hypothetical protein